MAGKQKFDSKKPKIEYSDILNKLKTDGPQRLYLMCGAEDFLRESFLKKLREACLGEGESDFNCHRLNGAKLDILELSEAVDSMPFMGGGTFIEVRDFEVNSYKDEAAEKLLAVLSDVPEYATVALLTPIGYEPDGRLSITKSLKKVGEYIEFTNQSTGMLSRWIAAHFKAYGKSIGQAECERLMFYSGDLMTGLLPEIEKIASYVSGDVITSEDIERVAHRIQEAQAFELTDRISAGNYDAAAACLAELTHSGEHPIKTLAMIGAHMRKIFAARVCLDSGRGKDECMRLIGTTSAFYADKIIKAANGFSQKRLRQILVLCCQADYKMKSSSEDDYDILKDLLLRMAVA